MSAVLSLSGCGPRLEVGLRVDGELSTSLVALSGSKPRNELIVAAVDLILRGAGVGAPDLGGVAASRGPGSFTGLRVTLATAQALVLAHDLRGHGFPSLMVQAARTSEAEVLAVQPARRGVVYAERFARANGSLRSLGAPELMETTALSNSELPVVGPQGLPFPAGVPKSRTWATTAEALLFLYDGLEEPDSDTLVPLYLEPPAATPPSRASLSWQPSPQER